MGREMRRAQERAERRQKSDDQPKFRAAPPPINPSAPAGAGARGSLLKPRWATDIIAELKKVTWPSRREVANLTSVVIVVSIALGALMGGADLFFGWLVEQALVR